MLEFVIKSVFWAMAMYGLIELVSELIFGGKSRRQRKSGMYILLTALEECLDVEVFLKSVIDRVGYGVDGIVISKGELSCSTRKIIERISTEYPQILILDIEEYVYCYKEKESVLTARNMK